MNIRVKALFIIAFVGILSACKKNDDAPPVKLTTLLNLVNASNATINFYQNGSRINNTTSYYPGGTLGYVTVAAGEQNFQVKNAGPATPNYLFSMPLKLDSGKAYSLYVSGQTAESVFYTDDAFQADTSGKAKLRFVNASPDAGGLVLSFTGKSSQGVILDTAQFSNVAYKTTTGFISVTSGVRNIGVYSSSSASNVKRDTVTLAPGGIYTLVSYGTTGPAGNQALGTTFIVNAVN